MEHLRGRCGIGLMVFALVFAGLVEAGGDFSPVDKAGLKYDSTGVDPNYTTAPWAVLSQSKVWTSPTMKTTVATFLSETISYVGNTKGSELVAALSKPASDVVCPMYLVGSTVVTAVTGGKGSWEMDQSVQLRAGCSVATLKSACEAAKYTCVQTNDNDVYIGDGADRSAEGASTKRYITVRTAATDMYLASLEHDTFTVNMLYYDLSRDLLIDKDGGSLDLTLTKSFSIFTSGAALADRVAAWYTPTKGAMMWAVEAEFGFPVEKDLAALVARRIKKDILSNLGDTKAAIQASAFEVMFSAVGGDVPAANKAQSKLLVAVRDGMKRDLGNNYYNSFVKSWEPDCPGLFDVVKDGEPFVRSYVPMLKTVRSEIEKRFKETTHYLVFARLRTAESLHSECRPLDNTVVNDIAGLRILAGTMKSLKSIVAGLKDMYKVNNLRTLNDNVDAARGDGYRSWDATVEIDQKTVMLQVRTVYMTQWAEWYHELTSVKKWIFFDSSPQGQEYKSEVTRYLSGLDSIREKISFEDCPDILKTSVLEHPDILSDTLHDGCFNWPDMFLAGKAKEFTDTFQTTVDYDDGSNSKFGESSLSPWEQSQAQQALQALATEGGLSSRASAPVRRTLEIGGPHRHAGPFFMDSEYDYVDRFEYVSPFADDHVETALQSGNKTPNPYHYTFQDAVDYIDKHVSLYHLALRTVKDAVGNFARVTARLKSPGSLYANFFIKDKKVEDYHDIIGLRISCETVDDLIRVRESMLKLFPGATVKYDPWTLIKEQGWYRSVHILPKANKSYGKEFGKKKNDGLEWEIQLRTPPMTFFADWSHDLIYKGDQSVKNDPAVKDYVELIAKTLLDLDKARNDIPKCPDVVQNVEIINSLTNPVENFNGCFHWHDNDAVTLDEGYVPPSPSSDAWPASAIAAVTAITTIAVVFGGVLCFWTVMTLYVMRKQNHTSQRSSDAGPINEGYVEVRDTVEGQP